MSLFNLKTWVHYYVALLKRLGPIKFSLLLAFAVIFFDACLQVIIAEAFSEPLDKADLFRSAVLGVLITPWAVYFLTVVVDDLDNARQRLGSIVKKLENISKDDKAKTDLLEKEIIEHQKTQHQLGQGASLLRSFLDTSPDLIFHRDLEGRFVSCNKEMEALSGKTEAELVGLSPQDLYSENYALEVLSRHEHVIKTHQEQIHECWLQYPNGRMAYFEVRALPLFNSEEECIGLISFGRDITERKKHQEFLEKASRDKTTFISTISHELRTPLNGIVGLSRMLLDENFNKEQTQYLKTIHMSAITLGNIFNDIVDLDKLDRRRLNLVKDRINTQDFMNDLQSLAYIQTEQKKLQLIFKQKNELPAFIESDDTRLRQVLWNLITNAVKFTKEGQVGIYCSSYIEDNQTWLCFEIEDTGIGIPQDKLEKIFAMYYQVEGNRHATGTGIGLAVSNRIVKAMSGHFIVTSELDKGSSFQLHLPVRCLPAESESSDFDAPVLSILLVEDIELNVVVARALLEKQGHNVDVAMDGQQAIDKVAATDYQLILMDIQLPDMDGYEVTRRLREVHEHLPPIVALTANVFSDPQKFLDKGIDDAISKPLNLSLFNNMLERHFSENLQVVNNDVNVEVDEFVDPETALFNEEMLKELMEFLPMSVMLDNLKLFENLMPEYLAILDSHMVAKNQKGIVSKSHKIKGAAASVGLLRIQKLAQKMQSPDLPAWWDNIDDWHELIKSLYLKDIKKLKKWIVANANQAN
ncbi:aerobic respiration two-component sensor histidine kinase ArcB [Psychromonas algicola]|uniref:aerobic respiration two-component sensor histidine kinase ArcB n=1 Tax=Psychromonas algicola TaxID=2555642 RepID=UPI001068218A|nr:aerobic respiration two-component sensor histidine kinase ArcB [Psychromonas sp. RZ5]TEW49864.1 aerobic respiration two-component sensor histidine kinase ArcB [Psychromonas sp. RZ5]